MIILNGSVRRMQSDEKAFYKLLWITRCRCTYFLRVSSVFSPLAYPGYNWMSQAVSDLSASNAPSLKLWNQLSSLYNVCTLVCAMMVCLGIQGKGNKLLRSGIYLFTIMEWVSAVGFGMFPLSESGYAGTFQDQMHIFSTIIVVLLSIVSLILIIISESKISIVELIASLQL